MRNSEHFRKRIRNIILSKDGAQGVLAALCQSILRQYKGGALNTKYSDEIYQAALAWLFKILFLIRIRQLNKLPAALNDEFDKIMQAGDQESFKLSTTATGLIEKLDNMIKSGYFSSRQLRSFPPPDDKTLKKIFHKLIFSIAPSPNMISDEYAMIDGRYLGSVYEELIDYKLLLPVQGTNIIITNQRRQRKSSGSFYTPREIVHDIVVYSIGKMLDEIFATYNKGNPLKFIEERVLSRRILDPAMGAGFFLIEAIEYMAGRIISFINKHRPSRGLIPGQGYWRQQIARHCIFGVDKNPLTVDLARLSIWSIIADKKSSFDFLSKNLKAGNSLMTDPGGKFDVIIGNPPYGNILDKNEKHYINSHYPHPWDRAAHNIVIPFIYRSWQELKEGGYLSFIIPKAVTYVENWKIVREFLSKETNLNRIIDNGQSFGGVLLEMVTFTAGKTKSEKTKKVRVGRLYSGKYARFSSEGYFDLEQEHFNKESFLVSINNSETKTLYECIMNRSLPLGRTVEIYRGLSINKHLKEKNNSSGMVPILRGRHIQPYGVNGQSYTAEEKITRLTPGQILFQEIVAHVYTPIPRIKLIGALNPGSLPTVNTVTNLQLKPDSKFTAEFILAALQSKIINWYIYKFIYINAFRTMHFSGTYARRAPIPDMNKKSIKDVTKIVQKMLGGGLDLKAGKDLIDQFFIEYYTDPGLSANNIQEILNVY